MEITILDSGQKRDRFTILTGEREILCMTIGQVCRKLKELCPPIPKDRPMTVPIPADVRADMEAGVIWTSIGVPATQIVRTGQSEPNGSVRTYPTEALGSLPEKLAAIREKIDAE